MSKLLWIVALVNTVGAIVLACVRYATPSSQFWVTHSNWVAAAVVVTLGVPLTQAAVIELGERSRRKKLELEQKVEWFLAASLSYLVHQGRADWENTGIQAFVVTGWWGQERQERLAKFRHRAITTSGVRWTKGKGVIGRCWETRQPQYVDLSAHFAQCRNVNRTEWDALTEEQRLGLTYDDYQAVKDKYGIIAAVPMVNAKDKYIGCVTADMAPLGAGATPPVQQEVLKSLAWTAADIVRVL